MKRGMLSPHDGINFITEFLSESFQNFDIFNDCYWLVQKGQTRGCGGRHSCNIDRGYFYPHTVYQSEAEPSAKNSATLNTVLQMFSI